MGRRVRGVKDLDKKGVNQTQCQRCGTCCKKNPPTIHVEDLTYINSGKIPFTHLITFRKGESAYDNINKKIIYLEEEIIKIKTKNGSSECIYFDNKTNLCTIYEYRPTECRLLKCWDTDDILKYYNKNRIKRFDIIPENSAMGEIIKEHEKKVNLINIKKLYSLYKNTMDLKIKEKLNRIISYDKSVREFIKEKTGAKEELNFLFGRDIEVILRCL